MIFTAKISRSTVCLSLVAAMVVCIGICLLTHLFLTVSLSLSSLQPSHGFLQPRFLLLCTHRWESVMSSICSHVHTRAHTCTHVHTRAHTYTHPSTLTSIYPSLQEREDVQPSISHPTLQWALNCCSCLFRFSFMATSARSCCRTLEEGNTPYIHVPCIVRPT